MVPIVFLMTVLPTLPDFGLLVLRLFLGALMMVHGCPKLFKAQERTQVVRFAAGQEGAHQFRRLKPQGLCHLLPAG